MKITKTLDAKGLACPMPVVQTKRAIDTINSGEVLVVMLTDKGALKDIPAWAKSGGHSIIDQKTAEDVLYFYIQKG